MIMPSKLFPVEILLNILINEHLQEYFCLTFVTETKLTVNIPINMSLMIIQPNNSVLAEQILDASEKGCSDYIIQMHEPENFMIAFEKVNHLGDIRRSVKKLIFLPVQDDMNNRSVLTNILALRETGFVANILLVVPSLQSSGDCKVYDMITHTFVGSDEDVQKPLYLDRWDSCTGHFERGVNLFPHNMSNLYGKTVKVAAFTYKPYVLLDLDPSLNSLGRDGMEMRIIDEFCRWVNCTVEIVRDDEHEWGEIYENNTGVGVLGNVVEDRADIGITALYSWYDEFRVLDFSAPIIRTAITCVAPAPRILTSWDLPLVPFTWTMWMCLVFTFFYASFALSIAQRSTDNVFLDTFGMMITQPLIKSLLSQFKTYPADILRQKSFSRSMAFSIEHLPAGYFAIGEYITKEAAMDLEIMLDKIYYEQCVVMLRKSSPYTAKLSELVGRLHQSGLMLSWETQVALKYLDFKVQLEVRLSRARKDLEEIEPLSIKQLLGIYIFYFGGVVIALLVFFGELLSKCSKPSIVL
ncbi:uncharacterized protein LOC133520013 isoform X2 [Cydia pomonella]|uniref:uncharacterized protein LOC133520013 isoform X2 n=1 Tax=Cydia pomonella TaxID=82600 RepID=UPI002ADD4F43|nr:uncharacterized protein LOC133520013 isoform X2 [Cydia pomonella]